MIHTQERAYSQWSALSIFLFSAAVIALQLMLMRALSVTHYHHFSYLVISTALLGFGASGTFLALLYDRLKKNFLLWNQLFGLLFVISIPLAYRIALTLPIDTQYLLYSGRQVFLLLLYNTLLFIPFFFGGTVIGFMLSYFKREVPQLYGANLAGSGLGGIGALGVMYLFPAHLLPIIISPIALLALYAFMGQGYRSQSRWTSAVFAVLPVSAIILSFVFLPEEKVDQYKDLARFQQLEQQEDARHVARRYGPRAQLDLFESETFHQTLFAGAQATAPPPPQLALLIDGTMAGPVFTIEDEEEASIMDFTPQSLPYRLLDRPHVLLLGETGGSNVWMAKRMGAGQITVVQPNPHIVSLMSGEGSPQTANPFSSENVKVVTEHPRLFLEQTENEFDLIQLVSAEAMTGGSGGLQGLNEEYLLTQEAVTRGLEVLSDSGLISITRGLQSPPRDNIKIFDLFIQTINVFSDSNPENHLFVSRNYLAVNTLLSRTPLDEPHLHKLREEAEALQLDLEYFPGIRSGEIQYRNSIEGPENEPYSYLHHAILQLLSEDRAAFLDEWAYHVQSPTDNRPYFYDFFKWSSLDRFMKSYGDEWFQRLELGYVVLFFTFAELALIAFILILLPLAVKRRQLTASPNKLPVFLHFFAIGIGFMFLEINFIQSFTRFLGDPVISASAVLTAILVFSGLGSTLQRKLRAPAKVRIKTGGLVIAGMILLYLIVLEPVLSLFIDSTAFWRYAVTLMVLFPVSFFLGWMFPAGIQLLENRTESLIPWAWGVNGFASVTAAPLAVILAMGIGFDAVMVLALLCYLSAAGASYLWD